MRQRYKWQINLARLRIDPLFHTAAMNRMIGPIAFTRLSIRSIRWNGYNRRSIASARSIDLRVFKEWMMAVVCGQAHRTWFVTDDARAVINYRYCGGGVARRWLDFWLKAYRPGAAWLNVSNVRGPEAYWAEVTREVLLSSTLRRWKSGYTISFFCGLTNRLHDSEGYNFYSDNFK